MTKLRDDTTYTEFVLRRDRSRQRSSRHDNAAIGDEGDDDQFEDLPVEFKRCKMIPLTFVEHVVLPLLIVTLLHVIFIPSFARHVFWGFHLWRWLVLIMVLFFGGPLSRWLTRIVIFLVARYFFLRIRFLYFVYGVRKSFRSCIWVFMVFLAWISLFDEKMLGESHALSQITKIFSCLMVATISRLVKTILLKVLASYFYANAYFDRIQDALLNQRIVEALSIPPHHESKLFTRSVARKDFSRRITIDHLHKVDKHNISSWSMRRLIKIMMYDTLTILDDQRRSGLGEDMTSMRIISEHEATLAAEKIFVNVAKPGAKNIDLNDLEGFFMDDEREKIMCHLVGTPNDGINNIALKNWVVNAYKCRRALTFALNDAKTIVKRLHQIANILVGIIVICIWRLILNIGTTQFFVLVGSQIFLATFIYWDTLKKIFESVKFLFITHPFDVGDHCKVDGAQMVVEEVNLLTTTFLRFDKSKIVLQNSKLVDSSIVNFYQGFAMGDKIDFDVHLSTPLTMIELLRERIILFMERSGHWHSGTRVVLQEDIDNTKKKLKISIIMQHRLKFHDMEMKLSRRELVVEELIRVLRELHMMYS